VNVVIGIFHPNLQKLSSVLLNVLFANCAPKMFFRESARTAEENWYPGLAGPFKLSQSIRLPPSASSSRKAVGDLSRSKRP
jgi:hypothetical protein